MNLFFLLADLQSPVALRARVYHPFAYLKYTAQGFLSLWAIITIAVCLGVLFVWVGYQNVIDDLSQACCWICNFLAYMTVVFVSPTVILSKAAVFSMTLFLLQLCQTWVLMWLWRWNGLYYHVLFLFWIIRLP